MDKKNVIFWTIVATTVMATIIYTYWHFVIAMDFTLVHRADCDPADAVCFVWECDPSAIDPEEQCTGDPDEDIWYYKIQRRIAANVPECDNDDDLCEPFLCVDGEKGCDEMYCTEELAAEEGVYCSDPDTYSLSYPNEAREYDAVSDSDDLNDDVDTAISDGMVDDSMIDVKDRVDVEDPTDDRILDSDNATQEDASAQSIIF